jgi:hypothetical protein
MVHTVLHLPASSTTSSAVIAGGEGLADGVGRVLLGHVEYHESYLYDELEGSQNEVLLIHY